MAEFEVGNEGVELILDARHAAEIGDARFLARIEDGHDAGKEMLRAGEEGRALLFQLDRRSIERNGRKPQADPSGLDQLALFGEFALAPFHELAVSHRTVPLDCFPIRP